MDGCSWTTAALLWLLADKSEANDYHNYRIIFWLFQCISKAHHMKQIKKPRVTTFPATKLQQPLFLVKAIKSNSFVNLSFRFVLWSFQIPKKDKYSK